MQSDKTGGRPLVGARLIRHGFRVSHWAMTPELDSFLLPESEFVAGGRDECGAGLRELFPTPHEMLERVLARRENADKCGSLEVPCAFHVFATPLLRDARDKDMAEVEEVVRDHGPVLIPRDEVTGLRNCGDFRDGNLVVAAGKGAYARLRYAPSQAKARRTREANRNARAEAKARREHLEAGTHRLIERLAQRIRQDILSRDELWFLRQVLDDWDPAVKVFGGGWGYRQREEPVPVALDEWLRRLRAVIAVHEKFCGRRAYRRLDDWAEARARYRAIAGELPIAALCREGEAAIWLAEMKARAPAKKPRPREQEA